MRVKTTLTTPTGKIKRHEGRSAITVTMEYEDPENADVFIEYVAEDYRELCAMITDLMKFAHEAFPNKGIVENAIHFFAKDEGMMIEDGIAHIEWKDKRN